MLSYTSHPRPAPGFCLGTVTFPSGCPWHQHHGIDSPGRTEKLLRGCKETDGIVLCHISMAWEMLCLVLTWSWTLGTLHGPGGLSSCWPISLFSHMHVLDKLAKPLSHRPTSPGPHSTKASQSSSQGGISVCVSLPVNLSIMLDRYISHSPKLPAHASLFYTCKNWVKAACTAAGWDSQIHFPCTTTTLGSQTGTFTLVQHYNLPFIADSLCSADKSGSSSQSALSHCHSLLRHSWSVAFSLTPSFISQSRQFVNVTNIP